MRYGFNKIFESNFKDILPKELFNKKYLLEHSIGDSKDLYKDKLLSDYMLSCTQEDNYIFQKQLYKYACKYSSLEFNTIMEVACGRAPSLAAIQEVNKDKPNTTYIGVDYARPEELRPVNEITYIEQDISDFSYPIELPKIDYATITWCTISYLDYEQLNNHMKLMSSIMNNNGQYWVGLGAYSTFKPTLSSEIEWEYSRELNGYGTEFFVSGNPTDGSMQVAFAFYKPETNALRLATQTVYRHVPYMLSVLAPYWDFSTMRYFTTIDSEIEEVDKHNPDVDLVCFIK